MRITKNAKIIKKFQQEVGAMSLMLEILANQKDNTFFISLTNLQIVFWFSRIF